MDSNNLTQAQTDQETEDLINKDIIELMGLANLDETQKNELRRIMLETVQSRVFRRIMDQLEEKGVYDQFKQLAPDAMSQFLIDHGIDEERMYVEEALILKAQNKTIADYVNKMADHGQ